MRRAAAARTRQPDDQKRLVKIGSPTKSSAIPRPVELRTTSSSDSSGRSTTTQITDAISEARRLRGPNDGNSNGGSSGGTANTASQAGQVSVAKTSAGKVLTDPRGRTLYVFARDTRGHSNCTGSCATYWPIAPGSDASKGTPAAASAKLSSIHRSDGSSQLTVNGFPAYTYVGDHGRGQANGQGLNISGGLWWVISPSGTKVTSSSGSSGSSSSSTSSGSSGSSGYGY